MAESLSAIDGVNAAVTDKGDGTFSLIINSHTGAKNALRFTVTEESGMPALLNLTPHQTMRANRLFLRQTLQ